MSRRDGSIGAVILAAGASVRMGRPKALLTVDKETFVNRAVRLARKAVPGPRVVVCAPGADEVRAAVDDDAAIFVENEQWEKGIGTSVARGIQALEALDVVGAAILVIDQPKLEAAHLETLVLTFREGSDPVATSYGGRPGVPAVFGRKWFEALRRLDGDRGAREILEGAAATVIEPELELADVDTPEDYERYET